MSHDNLLIHLNGKDTPFLGKLGVPVGLPDQRTDATNPYPGQRSSCVGNTGPCGRLDGTA